MISIDLTYFKLKRVVSELEVYLINQGSTSPLKAREHQRKQAADKNSHKVIYTPPNGVPFSILVTGRELEILSRTQDNQWHDISSLKTTKDETRKPTSILRQLGLIIGTMKKPSQYKLFGDIDLYPMGLGVGIKQVTDILPSISECILIEKAKARAAIAKRMANINKAKAFLDKED